MRTTKGDACGAILALNASHYQYIRRTNDINALVQWRRSISKPMLKPFNRYTAKWCKLLGLKRYCFSNIGRFVTLKEISVAHKEPSRASSGMSYWNSHVCEVFQQTTKCLETGCVVGLDNKQDNIRKLHRRIFVCAELEVFTTRFTKEESENSFLSETSYELSESLLLHVNKRILLLLRSRLFSETSRHISEAHR